jgi:hypothetical protein
MKRNIKNIFFTILHPSFWFMNYPYSKEWDEFLLKLSKEEIFWNITTHTVKIKNIQIWISNYPYAAFTSELVLPERFRPSRLTIYELQKKLHKEMLSSHFIDAFKGLYKNEK